MILPAPYHEMKCVGGYGYDSTTQTYDNTYRLAFDARYAYDRSVTHSSLPIGTLGSNGYIDIQSNYKTGSPTTIRYTLDSMAGRTWYPIFLYTYAYINYNGNDTDPSWSPKTDIKINTIEGDNKQWFCVQYRGGTGSPAPYLYVYVPNGEVYYVQENDGKSFVCALGSSGGFMERHQERTFVFGVGGINQYGGTGDITTLDKSRFAQISFNGETPTSLVWQMKPEDGYLYAGSGYNPILNPSSFIIGDSTTSNPVTPYLTNPFHYTSIDPFYWTTDDATDASYIASGNEISTVITATAWRRLQDKINEVEVYKGHSQTTFTRVSSGDRITAQIYNEIVNALSGIGGGVSHVVSGDIIYANLFNGSTSIKGALNRIIDGV